MECNIREVMSKLIIELVSMLISFFIIAHCIIISC